MIVQCINILCAVHSAFGFSLAMEHHPCILCNKNVTGRSQAIACDSCGRWNHRKCGTGITPSQYRSMQKGELSAFWRCINCEQPTMEVESHNSTAYQDIPPPMRVDVSPMRNLDTSYCITGQEYLIDLLFGNQEGTKESTHEPLTKTWDY